MTPQRKLDRPDGTHVRCVSSARHPTSRRPDPALGAAATRSLSSRYTFHSGQPTTHQHCGARRQQLYATPVSTITAHHRSGTCLNQPNRPRPALFLTVADISRRKGRQASKPASFSRCTALRLESGYAQPLVYHHYGTMLRCLHTGLG